MALETETVVVRLRQSIAGDGFSHGVDQLVAMPADTAHAYWVANVAEGVDEYDEEDVVPMGSDRRRGAHPGGRRATAEPGGRQATQRPAGETPDRRPAGQDRDGTSDDDEPSGDDDEVPATVDAVQAWVGDDPARAARALEVERARSRGPRSTLEPWLAERAG